MKYRGSCAVCKVTGMVMMHQNSSGVRCPMCVECALVCARGADVTHNDAGGAVAGPRLTYPTADNLARVHLGLSVADMQEIIEQRARPVLVLRMLRALQLLDRELAEAYANAYNIAL